MWLQIYTMGKLFTKIILPFIDEELNQDGPVDAEIKLSEMEFDEGTT